MEYEEIVSARYKIERVEGMFNFLLLLPNVSLFNPSYRWYLIDNDHDDDKFVDCYITANADFLIGNDRHFAVLNTIDFPKVNLLKYEEFENLYREGI
jgi:uncharacterized protein